MGESPSPVLPLVRNSGVGEMAKKPNAAQKASDKASNKAAKQAVKKATKARKKASFWHSKEVKVVYWLLGLPVIAILGWYAYTVAFTLEKEAMTQMEADMKRELALLAERAVKEGFRPEDVNKCKKMLEEYTTPKGWYYSADDLHALVGLPKNATQEQMDERCIYYAKAVAKMEKMSHHTRHVFVCGDSMLDVGNKGRFFIKADPKGRGALQNFDRGSDKLVRVRRGQNTLIRQWQIHNVGDGCLIIGLSKANTFRMSGKVVHKKKP